MKETFQNFMNRFVVHSISIGFYYREERIQYRNSHEKLREDYWRQHRSL